MKKKYFIEIHNTTIQEFTFHFQNLIHSEKELRMDGYTGSIDNNKLWIRCYPKYLRWNSYVEYHGPTILKGFIQEIDDGLKIEYYYAKSKGVNLLIGFIILFLVYIVFLIVKTVLKSGLKNMLNGFFICLILGILSIVILKIYLKKPDHVKERLENALLCLKKLCETKRF